LQLKADHYFDQLMDETAWAQDETVMFGKRVVTARKVAWYGDTNYSYTYSGVSKTAMLWTDGLRELRTIVEDVSGHTYNSCLLNLYADGMQGMGWHSDDEKMLQPRACIASLSLGAARNFDLKHRQDKSKVRIFLEHGSLLTMEATTQEHWQHAMPKTKKVTQPRINLTFRTIMASSRISDR
jgi:alkylated DNA repair dioxygenase AlkB